ncbi:MAG TPA: hypothetical protein VN903_18135 [Polyangia bacterium]|nr:hypothetical protein [Polyangia bacterium]
MSEDTSEHTGSAIDPETARKVSKRGGAMVVIIVVLALTLLMALNMN